MVSISMNPVVTENTRYENARKRSAEVAYTRHADYAGGNEAKRNDLAQRLTNTQTDSQPAQLKEFKKLGAGQLKQVALPLGETLEETIQSWRHVRSEALSNPEPSEVDHQLAAAASAKIMEAEAQLALENRLRTAQRTEESREDSMMQPQPTNSTMDSSLADAMHKLYDQATAAYSIQTSAKQHGYMEANSAYSLIA
ncbi:hypothetical protein DVB69_13570 [Sporosarcina sp. BI001-red]|uniref:hypothetical protein n=1 Tax=Sporosarcina sp. BI001-red TaxID=2282866 RepID=UPI000E27735C|nr:hypothetical protein [Sporosarcina sp. BI001-red]REB05968.1 hypothetical protein DVB69_13570 [Sporosarcina sp. BI001-red]